MKRLGSAMGAILGAITLALSLNVNANAAAASAKDEITAIENKILAATTADEIMKYFDDKDIVLYDVVPGLQYKGATAVHEDENNFFGNVTDVKGEFVELVVVADGKLGVARSIQHFSWKDKDGKPQEATLRVTDAYHKVHGEWKVFHSHVSVPVDLKTGQGQMNLKS
jgi:ketosteroid isomerase-like protein